MGARDDCPQDCAGPTDHEGRLISIYVAAQAKLPLRAVPEVRAEPGRGLEGDRYWARQGTLWKPEPDREITLIESESLVALAQEAAVVLEPADARRNLVTRGVRLNELVGRRFRVGEVSLRGMQLCEPCGHLERLAGAKLRPLLAGRAGLRAAILIGGVIRVGDSIEVMPESDP
jgi:MOSC domain-containing protein YiiM